VKRLDTDQKTKNKHISKIFLEKMILNLVGVDESSVNAPRIADQA
jgi:hypothetical protein